MPKPNLLKNMNSNFTAIFLVLVLFSVGCATASGPRPHPADTRDVGTIPDIIRASYEVLCGPAGMPRDWDRDRTLYMPGAMFVAVWEKDGVLDKKLLTTEEYRRDYDIGEGSYETEVGRRIERFGDVAEVRSVSVDRETPDGPIRSRYVNYYHLYWDGTRWWITGMVWDTERAGARIPDNWVGAWEEISSAIQPPAKTR